MESTSVVLPWSTCAMMATLRTSSRFTSLPVVVVAGSATARLRTTREARREPPRFAGERAGAEARTAACAEAAARADIVLGVGRGRWSPERTSGVRRK